MTEIHAAPGKVLKAVSHRSTGGHFQIGDLKIEEVEPLKALQEIADLLRYDTFICGDVVDNYYVVKHVSGSTETVWEIEMEES